MLQHIHRNNERGLTLTDIEFYMTATHGMSRRWVEDKITKWMEWSVVIRKANKYRLNESKWKLVQNMRQEEADRIEP